MLMLPDCNRIVLGQEWHALETKEGTWWRWSAKAGCVRLKTSRKGKSILSFTLLSSVKDNLIIIKLNGNVLSEIVVQKEELDFSIKVFLKRGTNVLHLSPKKDPINLQTDKRLLNFMIKDLEFTDPRLSFKKDCIPLEINEIKHSNLFYPEYYENQVPEIGSIDPIDHYCLYGAWEKKDPNPLFSSSYYFEKNPDVYLSGENPLLHYLQKGWAEGRDPHPEFSTNKYLETYPEVKLSGMNPLMHYILYGIIEGRNFGFSVENHKQKRTKHIVARNNKIISGSRVAVHWGNSVEVIGMDRNNIYSSPHQNKSLLTSACNENANTFFIVTPSFNSEKYIDSTIISVVSQEGDFEIIYHIQDGGSSDETIKKLENWEQILSNPDNPLVRCKRVRFSYEKSPDKGMYDAITKGFANMTIPEDGICTWINSDDLLVAGALSTTQNVFKTNQDTFWVVGAINGCGENGEELSNFPLQYPTEFIRQGLCDGYHWNFIQQEGSFWLKTLWDKVDGLDRNLKLCGDWDLWRRFAHHTDPVHVLWPLGRFRIHDAQLTSNIQDYYAEMESCISKGKRDDHAERLKSKYFNSIKIVNRSGRDNCFEYTIAPLLKENTCIINKYQSELINNLLENLKNVPNSASKLKVLTLCTLAEGGAGTGSQRRISALRKIGVDAKLLSLVVRSSTDYIGRVEPALDALDTSDQDIVWNHVYRNTHKSISEMPGYCSQDYFSSTYSVIDLHQLKPLIDRKDIVHLHWVSGMLDYKNMGKVLKNKPIVWTLADMNAFTGGCHYSEDCEAFTQECNHCPLLGGKSNLANEIWKNKKRAYEDLDINIVCPSKWIAKRARKSSLFSDRPIHVIPNAYPTKSFQPVDKDSARKKLGLPINKKLVLFGAISIDNLRKGYDLLEEAINIYCKQNPNQDIEAITFGTGDINLSIPVNELGYIEEDSLSLAYCAADVFISPSREDVGPMTVGESLLCGTPVVGFPIGILPEVGEHKVTAYFAEPFDANSMAQGIFWGLGAAEKDLKLVKKCRGSAERYCNPVRAAESHKTLYENLLSR